MRGRKDLVYHTGWAPAGKDGRAREQDEHGSVCRLKEVLGHGILQRSPLRRDPDRAHVEPGGKELAELDHHSAHVAGQGAKVDHDLL